MAVSPPPSPIDEPAGRKGEEGPRGANGSETQQESTAAALPRPAEMLISEDLFQGRSEVLIRHGDEIYRLRQTRNGKLILQK